jgi:hypothetical protein
MMNSSIKGWCRHPKVQCFILLALCGPFGLVVLAWGDLAIVAFGGGTSHLHTLYLGGFGAVCMGIASPLVLLPGKLGGHAVGIGMVLLVISSGPLVGDLHDVAEKKVQRAMSAHHSKSIMHQTFN